jgi:hypothetical protein
MWRKINIMKKKAITSICAYTSENAAISDFQFFSNKYTILFLISLNMEAADRNNEIMMKKKE